MHRLADNPDIDVLYVVTPTGLHKKYSVAAANAGKLVWCEKPVAMTPEECQEIIDACHKNGVKLSIGYRMQHEAKTQTIMRFAKEKPYGAIERLDVVVSCEKGSYYLRPMSNYTGVQGATSDGRKLDKTIVDQQAKQMDDDALAIFRDEPVIVPGEEGMGDIRIVQAAFESAREGRHIEL